MPSTVSGISWRCPRTAVKEWTICRQVSPPVSMRASIPPPSTKTVCTSALRGNWPFLEASSSLRGVACSVFSPANSIVLATAQQLGYSHEILRQPAKIVGDVLGHEVERQTKHHQPGERAEAEAFHEHVHLRNGAANDGENQVDQKRNGDDRRSHEEADQKQLARPSHKVVEECGSQVNSANRQDLVGALQREENPLVQVKCQKNHRAQKKADQPWSLAARAAHGIEARAGIHSQL